MSIQIFCDLDGVLVDFDAGVKKILKKAPDDLPTGLMWAVLKKTPDFYNKLNWTPNGKKLWQNLIGLSNVTIQLLTGVPRGFKEAEGQKRAWCKRELGEQFNVICCQTKDKPKYATTGAILIDDRLNIADEWIANGGIFIHHTSTENTIIELNKYINNDEDEEYEYIIPVASKEK
jgi:hypothetical protein